MSTPLPDRPGTIECYVLGWRALAANFWMLLACLGVVIVTYLPGYLAGICTQLAMTGAGREKAGAGAVAVMAMGQLVQLAYTLLVITPAMFGLMHASIRAARGETVVIEDALAGFRAWGRSVAAGFLNQLLLGVVALACMAPLFAILVGAGVLAAAGDPESARAALMSVLGMAILAFAGGLIPLVWVALRLGFYQLLVADGRRGPLDAFAASWQLTRGRTLTLLGIYLLAAPIALAGCAALCVGYFPAVLLIFVTWATCYAAAVAPEVRFEDSLREVPPSPGAGSPAT